MKYVVILGLLILAGCAPSMNQKMNAQIGVLTVKQAVDKWGAPISERKANNGEATLVWASPSYTAAQPEYVAPRGPTYGGTAGAPRSELANKRLAHQGGALTVRFNQAGLMQQWDYTHR